VHGRVKLCGLTSIEGVSLAARSGATHAGLILVPGTPRALERRWAISLARAAREHGLKTVGVFRDATPSEVVDGAEALGLDAVQLHGDEDARVVRADLPSRVEIWGVSGIGSTVGEARPGADRTLFDTVRDGQSGGSGTAFDWSLIAERGDLAQSFLAGGIGPSNARAAAQVGAYGLDVGSSVEASPGVKDPAKVAALFAALRPVSRGDGA
ncbi:MAG: hypothetical protein ACR2FK_04215, partial [Sphingomicrobium sp.]